jgi:hypothetical protein
MKRNLLTLMGVALVAAACSDGTAPGPQVSLSFSGGGSPAAAAPGLSLQRVGAPLSDGTNTLDITSAQVVLREIELERVEVTDCDVASESDLCEKFQVDAMLVSLPVDGSTAQELAIDVAPGTYDEIEFDIHKVSNDDPVDAAFRSAHPDFVGITIRVQGTYNGTPFTYSTDINEEQEFELAPPLVIDENTGSVNLTIRFDLSQWFVDDQGGLLDPATGNKGGENESRINENIKQSLEAFEDADRDGEGDA